MPFGEIRQQGCLVVRIGDGLLADFIDGLLEIGQVDRPVGDTFFREGIEWQYAGKGASVENIGKGLELQKFLAFSFVIRSLKAE